MSGADGGPVVSSDVRNIHSMDPEGNVDQWVIVFSRGVILSGGLLELF